MKKIIILLFLVFVSVTSSNEIYAKRASSGCTKKYTSKPAYAGFGKPSKVNGRIKTKATRGYFKPSNNYKFVNPYARSR